MAREEFDLTTMPAKAFVPLMELKARDLTMGLLDTLDDHAKHHGESMHAICITKLLADALLEHVRSGDLLGLNAEQMRALACLGDLYTRLTHANRSATIPALDGETDGRRVQ